MTEPHPSAPLRAIFPPVTTRLCRTLQPDIYRYLWRATSAQQIRLVATSVPLFLLSMAPLELQRMIIDDAIRQSDLHLLLRLCAVYLSVLLLQGALKFLFRFYQGVVAEGVVRVLRRRIATTDGSDDLGEGARVSMTVGETEELGGFVSEGISLPVLQGGILLSITGYMLVVEPLIAMVAIGFLIPSLVVTPFVQKTINRYVSLKIRTVRRLGNRMAGTPEIEGQPGRDSDDRYDELIRRVYLTRLRIAGYKFALKFFNNLLAGLGPLAILLTGGWLAIEGRTELGTIVAFISGYERMTDPGRQLLNFWRSFLRVRIQYRLLAAKMA